VKVTVDHGLCQGYATCVIDLPEVFDLNEADNLAYVRVAEVPEELRERALKVMRDCPTRAIAVQED
jgi:ferredoxin